MSPPRRKKKRPSRMSIGIVYCRLYCESICDCIKRRTSRFVLRFDLEFSLITWEKPARKKTSSEFSSSILFLILFTPKENSFCFAHSVGISRAFQRFPNCEFCKFRKILLSFFFRLLFWNKLIASHFVEQRPFLTCLIFKQPFSDPRAPQLRYYNCNHDSE